MLEILFCNLMCVYEYIYVRSSLAVVVFFMVKPESKISPGTNFAAEEIKTNFWAIFVYSCTFSNFESNRIAGKRSNIRNFEYELNVRPILNTYAHTYAHIEESVN